MVALLITGIIFLALIGWLAWEMDHALEIPHDEDIEENW